MVYEEMFKDLLEELKGMYKKSMEEQIAMNKEFMRTKKPYTGLQLAHLHKLEGESEVLLMIIGIMSDAIRLTDASGEEVS